MAQGRIAAEKFESCWMQIQQNGAGRQIPESSSYSAFGWPTIVPCVTTNLMSWALPVLSAVAD
jgi:hypothetical protein